MLCVLNWCMNEGEQEEEEDAASSFVYANDVGTKCSRRKRREGYTHTLRYIWHWYSASLASPRLALLASHRVYYFTSLPDPLYSRSQSHQIPGALNGLSLSLSLSHLVVVVVVAVLLLTREAFMYILTSSMTKKKKKKKKKKKSSFQDGLGKSSINRRKRGMGRAHSGTRRHKRKEKEKKPQNACVELLRDSICLVVIFSRRHHQTQQQQQSKWLVIKMSN